MAARALAFRPAVLAPLLAGALALLAPGVQAATATEVAPWSQRSFQVGAWCINRIAAPDLVALDAAGLDFLANESNAPSKRAVLSFAALLDSLHGARPGFRMRGLLFLKQGNPAPGDFSTN